MRKIRTALAVIAASVISACTWADACTAGPVGLVHWWPGQNSGADIIGSVNGVRRYGATFADGHVGRAFSFDGVDDYMHLGMLGTIGLTETDPFSIAVWVDALELTRLDSLQVVASNYMGERGGTGDYSTLLALLGDTVYFGIGMRQLDGVNTTTTLSVGWHLLVGTYDGTDLALYLDGALVSTATRPFSGSVANTRGWNFADFSPETNAAHAQLGGAPRNGAFNGRIDELQMFNRALTATDVASILASGTSGRCQPPPPTLDIDGSGANGSYAALTDGLLIVRYLLGLTGTALTSGAVSDAATRNADAVVAYLDEKLWALDVDDDGQYVAATDGVLILRYLLGFRGAALVDGAVSQFAGRTSTADIEAYLQSLTP